jgi:hypothetical protein
LNFVQNQQCADLLFTGLESRNVPLLFQPSTVAQARFIGGCIMTWKFGPGHDLPDKRGLAELARSGQHLHEAALLFQPSYQLIVDGLAYHNLLNTLSIITQQND